MAANLLEAIVSSARAEGATEIRILLAQDGCKVSQVVNGQALPVGSEWTYTTLHDSVRATLLEATIDNDCTDGFQRWVDSGNGSFRFAVNSLEVRGVLTATVDGDSLSFRFLPGSDLVRSILQRIATPTTR